MATAPNKNGKPAAKVPTQQEVDARAKLKRDNFTKLAVKRTSKLLKGITSLGQLGNRNSYSYTPEQIDKIFKALSEAITAAKAKFDQNAKQNEAGFTL